VHPWLVLPKLNQIFAHRFQAATELFGVYPEAGEVKS
jgi:hypothetical protein